MSHRREQLTSTLQKELQAQLARGLNDPRVRGLITITEVEVTEDLTEAVARVSILPAEHEQLTMHGLQAATAHLRREAGKRIRSRRLPKLRFELDKGFKKQQAVMEALAKDRIQNEENESSTAVEQDQNPGTED